MEIVISIGAKLSEYTFKPIARHLGYLFHYKSNLENLRTQFKKLKDEKERLEHSIDEATRNAEEIEGGVLNWINRVDGISKRTLNLLSAEGQGNTTCFSARLFRNLVLRNELSRKAKKLATEVDSEIQNAVRFDKVSYLPIIESSAFDVKGYVAFQSRMSTFNRIMEALRNPNLEIVGMYGMGGVGKTMLSKEVAKQAKEQKLFSKVIIVTVSHSPKVENIQQEIAEKLGLKLEEKTIAARAGRLRRRLRQEKKILVILDDIWEKLELQDIGIYFENDRKECKILLTSRSEDVLHNDMGVEKNFSVGVLHAREATNLFNTIAGDTIKNLGIQPLADEIVNECDGLPIAIATVANALRSKSRQVWKNALQELRVSAPTNIKGMHNKVYSSIRLSYDYLSSEEAKSLLLLCSLFHEDANIDIEYLLRHGAGWGLFHGVTKLEDARNKVVALVEDLKAHCLLLNGDFDGFVKMHDVIRDVTISIASRERQMYNLNGAAELEECFNDTKLKYSIAVSLSEIDCGCQLPERLIFPNAQVLLMRKGGDFFRYPLSSFHFNDTYLWHRDFQVSNHLFEELKELRVLEVSGSCLKPLPSSFSFLLNLQTLCLWHCDIGEVAVIGELKNLKILDLTGSNIEDLPKQIGQLTHLRLLDLKYCSKLKVIQPMTISSLVSLQELNMKGSFTNWKEVGHNGDRSNASLIELKSLHLLTSLHLWISHANILPKEFFSEKLERYDLMIGEFDHRYVNSGISRMALSLYKKRDVFNGSGLEMLIRRSEELDLIGLEDLNNVVPELDAEGFPQLKNLSLQSNVGIHYIVNSMEDDHTRGAFVNLNILDLIRLTNLEKICHGKLAKNCFGKLREIEVDNCPKLKNLFPFSIAEGLLQLEKIEVTHCEMMEEIIIYEREGDSQNIDDETVRSIQFPQLRTLRLCFLPKLKQFYLPAKTNCRDMQRKTIQLVSNFTMSLFNRMVSFPKLQNLILRGSPTLDELWHGQSEGRLGDEEPTCLFSGLKVLTVFELPNMMHLWNEKDHHTNGPVSLNLMSFRVYKCNRLKNLAPSWISFQNLVLLGVSKCCEMVSLLNLSTANSLAQLRIMIVVGCKSMTEIIEEKGSGLGGHDDGIFFHQLIFLKLRGLPSLSSFYSGKLMMGLPKLKYVSFNSCPELRSFSHGVVSTPQLDKIVLLREEYDDELYYSEDDFFYSDDAMEWPVTDRELDFDAALDDDFSDAYDDKPVEELMEGDINTTLSQLWERDQIGLALQQLFTEQV